MSNNQLLAIVERIEKLEDERSLLAADVKEIYTEAKFSGFEPKIIKKIISMRKVDKEKREEEQALLQTYMNALGMLADTPLGRFALGAMDEKVSDQ
jgi:uncharacterized protein (UPF0335 family)